jgi:hypothetical protein
MGEETEESSSIFLSTFLVAKQQYMDQSLNVHYSYEFKDYYVLITSCKRGCSRRYERKSILSRELAGGKVMR